jgi:hypothetical protein
MRFMGPALRKEFVLFKGSKKPVLLRGITGLTPRGFKLIAALCRQFFEVSTVCRRTMAAQWS